MSECVLSWVCCADTSVLIVVGLVHEAECVAVVLTTAREPVVIVIEPLPLIAYGITPEVVKVTIVQLGCLLQLVAELYEIVSDSSAEFSSVEQD